MLLVEQTRGKFAYLLIIREPEAASDLKMCSIVFYHTRYVHVMQSLCFITTFDYLNSLKDFCIL